MQAGLANGLYPEAVGREQEWLSERLAHHTLPQSTVEYQIGDRWLRVEERRTADGGSVGIRVDITDLKKTQESFRLLFDSNPLPMFLYDLETKAILGANDSMVSHYGYSYERLLRMNLRDLRNPADYNKPFQDFTPRSTACKTRPAPAGIARPTAPTSASCIMSASSGTRGASVGLTAIVDITEQQRATDELHATREFLNTVIENVPSAILVRNAADSVMRWSIALARNFMGCRANTLSATHRRNYSTRRSPTASVPVTRSCCWKVAALSLLMRSRRMPTPDDPRVINSRRMVVRGIDGEPKFFLSVAEDVTEQNGPESGSLIWRITMS